MHYCVRCVVFQHSGQEFHEDLYPDTAGTTPAMSAEEWWQGGNKQVKGSPLSTSLSGLHTVRTHQAISSVCPQVEKVSLQPDKQPKPKAPPAKQMPAKKELASRGSKEVRDTSVEKGFSSTWS